MKEIYKKLLEIQKRVKGLAKDKQGNSYSYVSGSKALGVIRPAMDELGVLLIPDVEEATYTRQDYATSKGQKTEIFVSLRMKFTWVDTESGETLEVKWASSGQNAFDKGLGSALTYGERYFLLKFFHIQTDYDDVDARQEEEGDPMEDAIAYINSLTTVEDLGSAWEYYKEYYGSDQVFKVAFAKKMQEVSSNGTGKK